MEWLLFVAKKTISALLYPIGTALLLWIAGLVLWMRRPRSRPAFVMVCLGGVWLLVWSLEIPAAFLVQSLERSAGSYAEPTTLSKKGVKHIVVLGGGVRAGDVSPTGAAAYDSLARVIEGIRLRNGIPGSKLVLSGGRYSCDVISVGEAMAGVARELGVPPQDMILETDSWDTQDEARRLKPLLGKHPFALVTSAIHMRRSLVTFRRLGLNPIPAPADFFMKEIPIGFRTFLPTAQNLMMTQAAIHEYLGLLWLTVKDVVSGPDNESVSK